MTNQRKMLHLPETTFNFDESILFKTDFDENDQINETPKWHRNQILIDTSQRHKQTIDCANCTHTFEIYNLQFEDSGVYAMRTQNLTVKTPKIKIIPKPIKEEEILPE